MSAGSTALAVYRLATGLAEPLAPAVLGARARRGKEDPARLAERLGRASRARPDGPLAWLHGASVGEALSLVPLATDLTAARPGLTVLVTAGTRTAAELLAQRLPPGAIHQYAPVDGPAAVARFLDHWRPDLGVFVESELWPNLHLAARERGVRMALLSAKLSDASLRGWSRFPKAAKVLFGGFDLVLAQDARAAERLERLGARVAGLADLKFGASLLPADPGRLAALKGQVAGRPVILAASTHPGEDEPILAAFAALPAGSLLVVVPRHPERGPEIAALAASTGVTVTRQGAGETIGPARAHVADALGELGLWYRLASLALVGGGWAAGIGGHNPLEPARLGCPFVSGPRVDNWRSAYAGLIEAEATAFAGAGDLTRWMTQAARRDPGLCAMAERAKAFTAPRDAEARGLASRLLALRP
jgi:3-deoxy-D-manno-octulosonic-acid transferase